MIRRLRAYLGRLSTLTAGTEGAVAHFCVHPCPEHAVAGVFVWIVSLVPAFRGR